MIVIGLTGSIGMGKSTAATMLGHLGIPTHDADAEVHKILSPDDLRRFAVTSQFPYFKYFGIYGRKVKGVRSIDRKKLGKLVFENPQERKKLEGILHPLVRKAQNEFIKSQRAMGRKIVALDIPLLFETGGDANVDYTITVDAPNFIQRARVLSRPNMNPKKFEKILQTQMPADEKAAKADYVVPTGLGRAHTMKCLKEIILDIKNRNTPLDEEMQEGAS